MGSLFIKEQSVEDRTRCGGCSHILVKAVKGVASSSNFGMVAGETEERFGKPWSGGHPEGEQSKTGESTSCVFGKMSVLK